MRSIEKKINEHTRKWARILNAGEYYNHFKRNVNLKVTNSELAVPKYLMFKDHKEKEACRSVVSGCNSNTL